jgi:hypothetical protein
METVVTKGGVSRSTTSVASAGQTTSTSVAHPDLTFVTYVSTTTANINPAAVTTSLENTNTTTSTGQSSPELSPALKIGIGITAGILIGLALCGSCLYFVFLRRRRRSSSSQEPAVQSEKGENRDSTSDGEDRNTYSFDDDDLPRQWSQVFIGLAALPKERPEPMELDSSPIFEAPVYFRSPFPDEDGTRRASSDMGTLWEVGRDSARATPSRHHDVDV